MQHKDDILPKLIKAGTEFMTDEKLCEIGNGFIVAENVKNGQKRRIDCDRVVLSLGSKPNKGFAEKLESAGISIVSIGDSEKVGKIADATKRAYEVAVNL